eukprot:scaffold11370_cov129-Isochrysis_galbana.AAC.8
MNVVYVFALRVRKVRCERSARLSKFSCSRTEFIRIARALHPHQSIPDPSSPPLASSLTHPSAFF